MSKVIKVYTSESCPECTQTKKWLDGNSIVYQEVDVTNDEEARVELRKLRLRSLPVVEVKEEGKPDFVWGGFQHAKLRTLIEG